MESTVFVLIMIFGGASAQSGYATLQQEFTTKARCEAARAEIAERRSTKDGDNGSFYLRVQGCFAK